MRFNASPEFIYFWESNKQAKVPFQIVLNPTIITAASVTKGRVPVLTPSRTEYEERSKKERQSWLCSNYLFQRKESIHMADPLQNRAAGSKSPLCKPAFVSPQIKKGRKPEFILRTLSCLPSQCKQPSPLLARLGGFPWPLADSKASHTENCFWQKIRKKECLPTFIYFICDCTRQGETVNAKYFILDRLSVSKRGLWRAWNLLSTIRCQTWPR